VFLIILPLIAKYNRNDGGYAMCLIVVFFIGVFNTMMQSSALAFAYIFTSENFISMFFTGSGIAGTLICLMKCIFMGSINMDNSDSKFWITMGYIIVSDIFLLLNIYFYIKFRSTNYCRLEIFIIDIILESQDNNQLFYQNQNFLGLSLLILIKRKKLCPVIIQETL
jgi:hypothetical protein